MGGLIYILPMQKKSEIKAALLRKYPEQVVLVTTRAKAGNPNVMAVGWTAVASGDPLMFMLGIDDEAYTYQLITETKEFTIAFPGENMGREVLHAGSVHGRGRDKITEAGLKVQDGEKVKAPLIADAVANFECELVDIFRPGDCPLVIGRVVAAHENADPAVKRLYTIGKNHLMGSLKATKTAGG
jgi:flavin reductase (DIM6/NTAB) family NADH-FMN oxidoreductase RutF